MRCDLTKKYLQAACWELKKEWLPMEDQQENPTEVRRMLHAFFELLLLRKNQVKRRKTDLCIKWTVLIIALIKTE